MVMDALYIHSHAERWSERDVNYEGVSVLKTASMQMSGMLKRDTKI